MSSPSTESNQPADPTQSVLVGGRYRLLQRIGSGGMGVVWLAHDEVLRRRVAVKELQHGWGTTDRAVAEGRERSVREARAAAALHHPNIVSVYDIVEHDGRPWIIMELVPGRSLKDVVVDDGPLPVERVVGIGLQLLSALQTAHAAGITHRDVKPANVLVSDGDLVRLTDFGLATMPDAETLTETGVVLGTPGYLAPEQAKGLTPGPSGDVFGLAATLYFAVEGVGPFHRDGYLPMLVAYARHDIGQPRRAGALGPVLLRMLAADPAKRPTAEQAREMLLGGAVRRSGVSRRLLLTGGAAVATAAVAMTAVAATKTRLWTGGESAPSGGPLRTSPHSASPSPSPSARPVGVGEPVWHMDDLESPVVVGSLLVGAHPTGVRAVDLETGKTRWHRGTREVQWIAGIGDGLVLVADYGQRHRVLDGATGAVRSTYRGNDDFHGTAGLVVELLWPSTLQGYDPHTGRKAWQMRAADGGEFHDRYVSGPGNLLYAESSQGEGAAQWLYAVNRRTGAVAWKTRMTAAGEFRLAEVAGGLLHAVVTEGRVSTLVAVDARTGRRRWAVRLLEVDSRAVRDSSNSLRAEFVGTLAVVGISNYGLNLEHAGLVAVDAGVVRWRRPLLNPAVAVTAGNRLFAASYDSVLHEIDPATGKTVWSAPTPGPADKLLAGPTTLVAVIGQGVTVYPLRPN